MIKKDGHALVMKSVAAERANGWTAAKEARFLAVLAATGNVRRALGEVGMSAPSGYHRRKTRPGFARAWREALCEGYDVLQSALLARSIAQATGDASDEGVATKPMSDALMLGLMKMHQATVMAARAEAQRDAVDVAALRRKISMRLDRLARSLGLEVKR